MVKHLAANLFTVLFIGLIALAGAIAVGAQSFSAEGPLEAPTRVTLERGVGLNGAARALEDAGVIESGTIFRLGARYKGQARAIKFGEYEIPAKASMEEVLDIVVSGRSIEYKVTVAEGLTSWEIVELLKANDLLTGEVPAVPAEGTLAPDTYFVQKGSTRGALINRMKESQERILAEAWAARDPDTPLRSAEEALVLASIIEKETGVASERAKVGGVFVNRLKRGMRLQSDPTIIYGITLGQGPLGRGIRRSEITKPTKYNTYVIDRLPPGPIANPGKDAILAAVQPEKTEFIYFVADGSGGHAFAKSLREHEKNVAAWRKIERARQNQ